MDRLSHPGADADKAGKQGTRPVDAMAYALDDGIDSVSFTPMGSAKPMTWKESLSANYTDGILILHKGHIVYEKHFGALNQAGKHAAMSMTKSMTGLLAEILVVEGALDDSAMVATIVPELKESAFGTATVRQVMDMTTASITARATPTPMPTSGFTRRPRAPFPSRRATRVRTDISSTCKP